MFSGGDRRITAGGKSPEPEAEGQAGHGHEKGLQEPPRSQLSQEGFGRETDHHGDRDDEGENGTHRGIVDVRRKTAERHQVAIDPDGVFHFLG